MDQELLNSLKLFLGDTNSTTIIRGPTDPETMKHHRYMLISRALYSLGYIYSKVTTLQELAPESDLDLTNKAGYYGFHSKTKIDDTFFKTEITNLLNSPNHLLPKTEASVCNQAGVFPDSCYLSKETWLEWQEIDKQLAKEAFDAVCRYLRANPNYPYTK